MHRLLQRRLLGAIVAGAAALAAPASHGGVITPELAQEMARHVPGDRIPVIVELAERVDPLRYEQKDRRHRDTRLMQALKAQSERALARLQGDFDQAGAANRKALWINHAIALTLPVRAIDRLARHRAVARIQFDATLTLPALTLAGAAIPALASGSPGWNLTMMHVPEVWSLGVDGAGAVVATMDTGVDLSHPDLEQRWRGGANSWFDPYLEHATPYDANGHGTQAMGLAVGGSAGGTAVGVAPGARWIAAKIFNDAGQATLSTIHQAFQWLLDPDGDPATVDAPDIVNASWGLTGGPVGACNMEFNDDIVALNAAGTAVVFAAGNDGPAPASAASPAANPAGFGAGSIDQARVLYSQSSRGPSGCDGGIFPKLVAPGVNVVSSDLSFGGLPLYATVSGTSFAAPHVAGALALLAGAFPSANVTTLKNALVDSAADLGAAGPDNNYGYGLVDVQAARARLANGNGGQNTPVITSLPATDATEGQPYRYLASATDPDGGTLVFGLAAAPAGMRIDAVSGQLDWTPAHAQLGANPVTVTVTDPTARAATQSFSILVAAANSAPLANPEAYSVTAGATLKVARPGVLANDQDADGDALVAQLVAGPAHGTLALGADGAFEYRPAAGYNGPDSFSYRASDGKAGSNSATVALTVLAGPAPVARNDSFTAAVYRSSPYAAPQLALLANDSGVNGIVAPTLAVVAAPNKGGRAVVNADGSVAYTPAYRYSGVETFTYRVRDSAAKWSNTATVTVTVK